MRLDPEVIRCLPAYCGAFLLRKIQLFIRADLKKTFENFACVIFLNRENTGTQPRPTGETARGQADRSAPTAARTEERRGGTYRTPTKDGWHNPAEFSGIPVCSIEPFLLILYRKPILREFRKPVFSTDFANCLSGTIPRGLSNPATIPMCQTSRDVDLVIIPWSELCNAYFRGDTSLDHFAGPVILLPYLL